jgi:hypothetical protein
MLPPRRRTNELEQLQGECADRGLRHGPGRGVLRGEARPFPGRGSARGNPNVCVRRRHLAPRLRVSRSRRQGTTPATARSPGSRIPTATHSHSSSSSRSLLLENKDAARECRSPHERIRMRGAEAGGAGRLRLVRSCNRQVGSGLATKLSPCCGTGASSAVRRRRSAARRSPARRRCPRLPPSRPSTRARRSPGWRSG